MAPRLSLDNQSRVQWLKASIQPLFWGLFVFCLGEGFSRDWSSQSGLKFRFPQSQKVQKTIPASPEMMRVKVAPQRRDRLAIGRIAAQVPPNSSYLLRTDVVRPSWSGIPGVTASGHVLPVAQFHRNAETCGDWMTQVGLSQRDYETRRAHGLSSAFDEQIHAQRLNAFADQIGNEVLSYHSLYHRERARNYALSVVDRRSEVYRFLAAPIGIVAAVAAWGTGTPIEVTPAEGWKLMSETRVASKTSRLAIMSGWLGTTDVRIDLSDPTWAWYAATFSRSLPMINGLSARLSAVRVFGSEADWVGQGPMLGETVALEYQLRF